jgi:RHS repeat-associated protein
VPGLQAVVGQAWAYAAHAVDPDGDTVTYALVSPPGGMTIDAGTGLAQWTPGSTGSFTVALQASDPMSAFGAQVFTLDVVPVNNAPVITSTPPPGNGIVGGLYQYDVDATDADGHELLFEISPAPSGMTIHPQTGLISWTPHIAQASSHGVTVHVSDRFGGQATQSFSVTVDPDLVPPTVSLVLSSPQVAIGNQAQACVEASDDVGVTSKVLLVDGVPEPLDLLGCAILVRETPVTLMLRAEAMDAGGNLAVEEAALDVVDPSNGTAPSVTLISPAAESVLTAPTDIVATITDDTPAFLTWEVSISPTDVENFTVIGSGSGDVTGSVVATVDPTILPNDAYRIRIVGDDGLQTGGIEFLYHVAGDNKIGHFETSFVDLALSVGGIPMVITRRYSSLDTRQGDFGAGWALGLPGDVDDTPDEDPNAGGGFGDLFGNEAFSLSTRVTVTRPDGRRVGFTFDPVAGFLLTHTVRFTPDPGVTDTLEAVGQQTVWGVGGLFYDFIIPYNPNTYVLTTKEGVRYTIDEVDGLQSVEDRAGNTLTVTPGGLVSSAGVSLTFERDLDGRITKIIEPADPLVPGTRELDYVYDGLGNLVTFRDQLDNPTDYFYEDASFPHYLTRVEDPLDRPIIRTVFDSDGRVTATCPADGDIVTLSGCTTFAHDAAAGLQTIINARGFRTDLFFNSDGNILTERRWLDGVSFLDTVRTYDAAGNTLSRTDPEGNTASFTYDAAGNVLTMTTRDGRTWTLAYDPVCQVESQRCSPAGECQTFAYDSECNLRFITDALGNVTERQYNSLGQVTHIIDPNGTTWEFLFGPNGGPAGQIDPSGNTISAVFSLAGNLLSRTDGEGQAIDYTYDDAGRMATETWDTVPPTVITYTHDAAGQLRDVSGPDSVLAFDYWDTGELRSVDNAGTPGAPNVVVTYGYENPPGTPVKGYDANGNLTHVTDSEGGQTEYEYDALDRLTSIRQSAVAPATVAEKRLDIGIDDAGLVRTLTRYQDVAGTLAVAETTLTYECPGCETRLSGIHHRDALSGVLHDLDFTRDDTGDVLTMTDAEGSHLYEYDGLGRILSADHPAGPQPDESYTYDAAGNRLSSHLSASQVYGYTGVEGGDLLLQDDTYDYEYDGNGKLSKRTDRSTSDYTDYEYDHRGRMVAVRDFDVAATPTGVVTHLYDSADRRIQTDDNGTVSWYFYDGLNPTLVLDGAGSLVVRRLYGRGLDDLLADEVSGGVRWFLTDQVGTVRDLIDNSATSLDHYVYDSFGRLLSTPSTSNALLFSGREYDGTGLGYYRARYYDPNSGRFLAYDPRIPMRYTYADNNPLLFIDPTGQLTAVEYGTIASESLGVVCTILGFAGIDYDNPTETTGIQNFYDAWTLPIIAALNGEPVPETNVLEALADWLSPNVCGFSLPVDP